MLKASKQYTTENMSTITVYIESEQELNEYDILFTIEIINLYSTIYSRIPPNGTCTFL